MRESTFSTAASIMLASSCFSIVIFESLSSARSFSGSDSSFGMIAGGESISARWTMLISELLSLMAGLSIFFSKKTRAPISKSKASPQRDEPHLCCSQIRRPAGRQQGY